MNSKEAVELPEQLGVTSFMDALSEEIAILDKDGVVVATNASWNKFCADNGGDTSRCYRGTNYLDICRSVAGRSSAEAAIVPDGFAMTLQTGVPFRCEYPCDSPNEKRWFEMTANRIIVSDEPYLIVQHQNITKRHVEREAVEMAHVTSSAMTALIATTSDAILSYDLDGNILTWNRAAERLYGYSEAEIRGRSLEILYPQSWPKRLAYYRDEILAGRLERFEATRVAKDGTHREVWISGAPIRDVHGEVVAISNIHRDVSEVRKIERARELVAHEVVHRAKNMLTIVTAIQRQTARVETTLEDFTRSFEARVSSLSKSTDLLVKSEWRSIDLFELTRQQLEPFLSQNDSRVAIDGPPVTLQPQFVQTVGMVFHELATNSAKYGALTQNDGTIRISWSVETGEGPSILRLSWQEAGSSILPAPRRKGYGNTVLTKLAPSLLDAEVKFEITSGEVIWAIDVSAEHFDVKT